MKPDYKLVAKAKYIHMTADLASELWHEVYKRYYPAKQLDALVETLQSADAIDPQKRYHYAIRLKSCIHPVHLFCTAGACEKKFSCVFYCYHSRNDSFLQ